MSDTPTVVPNPDLDAVDHTDPGPVAGAADVSPAAPAPAPADTRSEAEQALAPQPVADPGPAEPAVAQAPEPTTETAAAPAATVAPATGSTNSAAVVKGDVDDVLRAVVEVLLRIEAKIDGVVDDVGSAKEGLSEFAKQAPGMLGGLKHLFGG